MKLLLQLWLYWHLALCLVAIARRAPAHWWIRCGAMRARVWFFSRVWVGWVKADGWVGYYHDAEGGRIFIALCPWLVLRLSVARRDRADAFDAIMRSLTESKRARGLSDPELAADLDNLVGINLAIGTRAEAVCEEVTERLRGGVR